jgi:hypothetical protein
MQFLVARARKAAADKKVGITELQSIDHEITEVLSRERTRAETQAECRKYVEILQRRREKDAVFEAELKRVRTKYLVQHDRLHKHAPRTSRPNLPSGRRDYSKTIQFLKAAIKATKSDIVGLKLRSQAQGLAQRSF